MKRHRHILLVTLLTGIVVALAMAMHQASADASAADPNTPAGSAARLR